MLIIHLQHPEEHEFSYVKLAGNAVSGVWQRGNWGEVSGLAQHDSIILLIPGRDVLLTQVTLVTTNSRHLKQALPYALEENLVGDPADQHFVWQARADSPHVFDVAVIRRDILKGWMELLKKHRVRARTILPDVFALPVSTDEHAVPVIVQQGEQVWVRTGALSGFVAPQGAAPLLINGLFATDDDERAVWLATDQVADWHQHLSVLHEPPTEMLLRDSIQHGAALNLLTGYQDASMSSFTRHWRRWRVAAAFAVITLGILAALEGMETYQLRQQLQQEEQQNLVLFKQVFRRSRMSMYAACVRGCSRKFACWNRQPDRATTRSSVRCR
ncbi:MAG: type II secretion system protein GspL [Thiolinea sp.]